MNFDNLKTPKGTELPMLNLKGKPYLQVAHRLVWMREEHPDWGIETEIVSHDATRSVAKATIRNELGRIIAQATKQEEKVHFLDHLEKCETGAIGRALALCGYGTQFAPEFDEGERLADSPIMPAQMANKTLEKGKVITNGIPFDRTKAPQEYKSQQSPLKDERLKLAASLIGKPEATEKAVEMAKSVFSKNDEFVKDVMTMMKAATTKDLLADVWKLHYTNISKLPPADQAKLVETKELLKSKFT